jgi:beta-glucosidase
MIHRLWFAGETNATGQQLSLLSAVLDASEAHHTQLVVVTICGRPVTFGHNNEVLDRVPAMISAFRPGEEGGRAIADLIVGEYSPSGRLAQNWLRSVGQIYSPANPWYQYKWGSWFENVHTHIHRPMQLY